MQSETGERSSREGERGLPARCVRHPAERFAASRTDQSFVAGCNEERAGCKRNRGAKAPPTLPRVDGEYLAAFVVATGRACGMRGDSAAALRALVQLRSYPTMRCLACAQPHLRDFAFWNSHKSGLGKQEIFERQQGSGNRQPLSQLELVQRTPIRLARGSICFLGVTALLLGVRSGADPLARSVATRICR